jgi:hypothetical protein
MQRQTLVDECVSMIDDAVAILLYMNTEARTWKNKRARQIYVIGWPLWFVLRMIAIFFLALLWWFALSVGRGIEKMYNIWQGPES